MNLWTDDLTHDPWRERRARRQRMIALLVILAMALPTGAILFTLVS